MSWFLRFINMIAGMFAFLLAITIYSAWHQGQATGSQPVLELNILSKIMMVYGMIFMANFLVGEHK